MYLYSILFYFCCLMGFTYHFYDVASMYFRFATTTRVDLPLVHPFNKPSLVFCARFNNLLDRREYKKYGIGKDAPRIKDDMEPEVAKLTVKDIFHLTPSPQDFLTGCRWRDSEHDLTHHGKETCDRLFKVFKYLEGRNICYVMLPLNYTMDHGCDIISKSIYYRNEIYIAVINETITLKMKTITMLSFLPRAYTFKSMYMLVPHASRRFAHRMFGASRVSVA